MSVVMVKSHIEVTVIDEWPKIKILVVEADGRTRSDVQWWDKVNAGHYEPYVKDALTRAITSIVNRHKQQGA